MNYVCPILPLRRPSFESALSLLPIACGHRSHRSKEGGPFCVCSEQKYMAVPKALFERSVAVSTQRAECLISPMPLVGADERTLIPASNRVSRLSADAPDSRRILPNDESIVPKLPTTKLFRLNDGDTANESRVSAYAEVELSLRVHRPIEVAATLALVMFAQWVLEVSIYLSQLWWIVTPRYIWTCRFGRTRFVFHFS